MNDGTRIQPWRDSATQVAYDIHRLALNTGEVFKMSKEDAYRAIEIMPDHYLAAFLQERATIRREQQAAAQVAAEIKYQREGGQ